LQPQPILKPIVLASGSPRRKELLELMGIPFETAVFQTDEQCEGTPWERVCKLAERKAQDACQVVKDRLILAADTLVAQGERVFGKPESPDQAVEMLLSLGGGWHEVYTGVCLLDGSTGKKAVAFDKTLVRFSPLDKPLIEAYVRTGEPMDKAGAYAIQGRGGMFVEEIRGSSSNVIGLPMALVRRMLLEFGVDVL
jgi:septum formation protein